MRKTETGLGRRWLRWMLLALSVGLMMGSALAVLSDNTGRIQGRAPTVSGNVQVLYPDGATVVQNGDVLGLTQIPNQFQFPSDQPGLILQDADGDAELSVWVDTASATLTWTHNGTPLTSAQLAAPLGNNFAGQTLALAVSVPVTVGTWTGMPNVGGSYITSAYTLAVDMPTSLDISLDSNTAYVEGGTIMMTVTARGGNGAPLPGTVVNFTYGDTAVDRQGNTGGWTGINGELQLAGTDIGSQTFTTGAGGTMTIPVTHPGGLGVKSTILAFTTTPLTTATTDVIFPIITSPDTPLANMYGHMTDVVTVGGVSFKRPLLVPEASNYYGTTSERNETWPLYNTTGATTQCGGLARVPSLNQLRALYAENPDQSMHTLKGWPRTWQYKSSTIAIEIVDGYITGRMGVQGMWLGSGWDEFVLDINVSLLTCI